VVDDREEPLTPQRIALIEQGFALVRRLTLRLRKRFPHVSESFFHSAGYWALVEGTGTFNGKGSFILYVWRRVHGRMIDEAKALSVSSSQQCLKAMHKAGYVALEGPLDEGDVLNDDESATFSCLRRITKIAAAAGALGYAAEAERPNAEDLLIAVESREIMRTGIERVMRRIKPKYARVIQLHFYESKPMNAVARELDVSYAQVRRDYTAIMLRLAVLLPPEDVAEAQQIDVG
jgi:RNA polymerase sigma factor (sigma-70 family)